MKRILKHKHVPQILGRNYSIQECKVRQVFSAIQPTGVAHLGNYLGALKKWVDLQNSEENASIYGIADLHSITIPKIEVKVSPQAQFIVLLQDPKELKKNIFIMAATVLACGIDMKKSILFQQSEISQHTDLCWILGTLTTQAKLSRLPQYKEKCELVKDASVGIFLYPVLQAADVMLYRATHIPVGDDQIPQIQLAQNLIKKFNNRFQSNFPIPDIIIDSFSGRIKSLSHPTKKMSKSDEKEISAISLLDEPDDILKKVKKAVTDFTSAVTYEPDVRPGVSNLITIHSGLTGKTPQQIVEESINLDTGMYKLVLAEVVIEHLNPIRKKIIEYLSSKEYLLSELEKGTEKAREIAERNVKEIKERMGLDLLKENITKEQFTLKAFESGHS